MEEGGKRYAVLQCAEDSEYVKEKYGGYFNIFVEMLGEEGETWNVYRVSIGEFPKDDELGDYNGYVITGSCSDAHGDDLWIINLVNLLQKLHSINKQVLGVCFGHQIMGRAVGGKTGRAKAGWDIGVTTLQLSSSSSDVFKSLEMPATLSVIECHRDEVYELPPKAEIMAWSSKIGIEMFRYGDHMMGIQGHPEYTKDILLKLIDSLVQRHIIQESLAEEAKRGLDANEPDREALRKLCTSFLKGRLS